MDKIVSSLQLKVSPYEIKSKDARTVLSAVFSRWLPLSTAVLVSVIEYVPPPAQAQREKVPRLVFAKTEESMLSDETRSLLECVKTCCNENEDPTVAIIAKLFTVSPKDLPVQVSRQVKQMTGDEIRAKREAIMKRIRNQANSQYENNGEALQPQSEEEKNGQEEEKQEDKEELLVGFARIYSGCIRRGQTLHVLGPKYDPREPEAHRSETTVEHLYILMGRDMEEVDCVPAGNVFGIITSGGMVFKWSTLSSSSACFSFGSTQTTAAVPVVRVAVEPADPTQMPQLIQGLRILNQSDASVEVLLQETGEHVLLTAGELHLERCLRDLRERYAKIGIHVSPPIVPFRETVVEKTKEEEIAVEVSVGQRLKMRIRAFPLPQPVIKFLLDQQVQAREIMGDGAGEEAMEDGDSLTEQRRTLCQQFLDRFNGVLSSCKVPAWLNAEKYAR